MQAQGVKVQVLTSGRRAVGPLEQQQEQMHLQCQEPLPAAAVGLLARLLLGLQPAGGEEAEAALASDGRQVQQLLVEA